MVLLKDNEETIHRLIDSNNNQFVMSKSQDSTVPHEDVTLLVDLVYITSLSTVLSLICSQFNIPIMFGQIISGVIMGPSGINVLDSPVQIETLAEIGVFFIMFTVGLEFSPDHIRKVSFISTHALHILYIYYTCAYMNVYYTCVFMYITHFYAYLHLCMYNMGSGKTIFLYLCPPDRSVRIDITL